MQRIINNIINLYLIVNIFITYTFNSLKKLTFYSGMKKFSLKLKIISLDTSYQLNEISYENKKFLRFEDFMCFFCGIVLLYLVKDIKYLYAISVILQIVRGGCY
jgi:hypothetical protein